MLYLCICLFVYSTHLGCPVASAHNIQVVEQNYFVVFVYFCTNLDCPQYIDSFIAKLLEVVVLLLDVILVVSFIAMAAVCYV